MSLISIPVDIVQSVQEKAAVTEILWPLGAYVMFQPNGMTLALFGRHNDELVHRGGLFELGGDKPANLGLAIWDMWKDLKDTPEEELQENLKALVHESVLRTKKSEETTDLAFFTEKYARTASEALKIPKNRIQARLLYIEEGQVVAELYVGGQLVKMGDPRLDKVSKAFERYLSTAKPN
jgi:hypothetical protein